MRTRLTLALLAAGLTITSSGCGSQDDDLSEAVHEYSNAFLTGDARTSYALLSERCRSSISEDAFTSIVRAAEGLYGNDLPIETYEAVVDGETARVTYSYAVSALNQDNEPWVFQDGWRNDDC